MVERYRVSCSMVSTLVPTLALASAVRSWAAAAARAPSILQDLALSVPVVQEAALYLQAQKALPTQVESLLRAAMARQVTLPVQPRAVAVVVAVLGVPSCC